VTASLSITWLAGTLAGVSLAVAGGDAGPFVHEALDSDVYTLQGSFEVAAVPHVVWDVLTDYTHLPHFVPGVLTSIAEPLVDGHRLVSQEFEARVLVFSRDVRVRLDVQEQPEQHVSFRDVSLQDFDLYQGSWSLQPMPGGTRVDYALRAKPRDSFPEVLANGAFKDNGLQMLFRLRNEMLRRQRVFNPTTSN
jgi:carbon monoxide dehydrogenase subunit G